MRAQFTRHRWWAVLYWLLIAVAFVAAAKVAGPVVLLWLVAWIPATIVGAVIAREGDFKSWLLATVIVYVPLKIFLETVDLLGPLAWLIFGAAVVGKALEALRINFR